MIAYWAVLAATLVRRPFRFMLQTRVRRNIAVVPMLFVTLFCFMVTTVAIGKIVDVMPGSYLTATATVDSCQPHQVYIHGVGGGSVGGEVTRYRCQVSYQARGKSFTNRTVVDDFSTDPTRGHTTLVQLPKRHLDSPQNPAHLGLLTVATAALVFAITAFLVCGDLLLIQAMRRNRRVS